MKGQGGRLDAADRSRPFQRGHLLVICSGTMQPMMQADFKILSTSIAVTRIDCISYIWML